MRIKIVLIVIAIFMLVGIGSASQKLSSPTVIDKPGVYKLNEDLEEGMELYPNVEDKEYPPADAVIHVRSDDVLIDGNGHEIRTDPRGILAQDAEYSGSDRGDFNELKNVTIKNIEFVNEGIINKGFESLRIDNIKDAEVTGNEFNFIEPHGTGIYLDSSVVDVRDNVVGKKSEGRPTIRGLVTQGSVDGDDKPAITLINNTFLSSTLEITRTAKIKQNYIDGSLGVSPNDFEGDTQQPFVTIINNTIEGRLGISDTLAENNTIESVDINFRTTFRNNNVDDGVKALFDDESEDYWNLVEENVFNGPIRLTTQGSFGDKLRTDFGPNKVISREIAIFDTDQKRELNNIDTGDAVFDMKGINAKFSFKERTDFPQNNLSFFTRPIEVSDATIYTSENDPSYSFEVEPKNTESFREGTIHLYERTDEGWEKVSQPVSDTLASANNRDSETKTYALLGESKETKAEGKCREMKIKGNPSEKIDVVFVGHEYTDAQELEDHARKILGEEYYGLFDTEAFDSHEDKFNFYTIKGNGDIGVDQRGEPEDTEALKLAAECTQAEEQIILSKRVFRSYAVPNDYGVVSVGDKINGGDVKKAVHEFGHSFAGLKDEYVEKGKGSQPGRPNCASDRDTAEEYWGEMTDNSQIGFFEGCSYVEENIRPTKNSIMRNTYVDEPKFGPVNRERIEEVISN